MSHISRIRTRMVEKQYILDALNDMGYEYVEGDEKIRGFGAETTRVQIRVKVKTLGRDIGLRMNGETWEIVADWWAALGIDRKVFTEKLYQCYAVHAAKAQLQAQGFQLVNEENGSEGRVHLVLRRMA